MARLKGFAQNRREALRIARDLCYSKDVIERIKRANTDEEIRVALATGRENIVYHEPDLAP